MSAHRPNPILWLWQAFGGRLPRRYWEWVLHDSTVRTWWLRHLLRTVIRMVPPMAVMFVILHSFGGPLWLVLTSLSIGLIVAVYYSLSYADENTNSRLTSYGYPPKYGTHVREQAKAHRTRQAQERYEATWREDQPPRPSQVDGRAGRPRCVALAYRQPGRPDQLNQLRG